MIWGKPEKLYFSRRTLCTFTWNLFPQLRFALIQPNATACLSLWFCNCRGDVGAGCYRCWWTSMHCLQPPESDATVSSWVYFDWTHPSRDLEVVSLCNLFLLFLADADSRVDIIYCWFPSLHSIASWPLTSNTTITYSIEQFLFWHHHIKETMDGIEGPGKNWDHQNNQPQKTASHSTDQATFQPSNQPNKQPTNRTN